MKITEESVGLFLIEYCHANKEEMNNRCGKTRLTDGFRVPRKKLEDVKEITYIFSDRLEQDGQWYEITKKFILDEVDDLMYQLVEVDKTMHQIERRF